MSLFGRIIRTAVNVVIVPAAVVADVVIAPVTVVRTIDAFMGGEKRIAGKTCTERAIDTLKEEAED